MRLEGNFYTIHNIEQKIDNSFAIEVKLSSEHPIYEGHFPQQAVVPGVCTLTIIKECIRKILSKEISFKSIKECKYVSALVPNHDLRIAINLLLTNNENVSAIVERVDNQQTVLKLKAVVG